MKRIILYGAGENGREALKILGPERVAYFCDNNEEKVATFISGKEVISYEKMISLRKEGYQIVVTPSGSVKSELLARLESDHISDYEEYVSFADRYVKDRSYAYGEEAARQDAVLEQYVKRARSIDFLSGIDEFRLLAAEVVEEYKKRNRLLMLRKYGESGFYGNIHALLHYAGMKEEGLELAYLPTVCHHDAITEHAYLKYRYDTAVIFPGYKYRKLIHERKPLVPVFLVGPYILYAKSLFSESELTDLKRKYGKTAAVYLTHMIEGETNSGVQKQTLDRIYDVYGKQYDTLFLSVYWTEAGDEIYAYAQKKGFQVISAGFRFDSDFDRRLKAVFELSDLIITDSYSTPLTCALALKKPIVFTDHRVWDDEIDDQTHGVWRNLFYTEEYYRQHRFFDRIFNHSTGEYFQHMDELECALGLKQVKSVDEMRAIFEISRLIWEEAQGDLVWYYEGVRRALKKLEENNDETKLRILGEALGGRD